MPIFYELTRLIAELLKEEAEERRLIARPHQFEKIDITCRCINVSTYG